MIFTFFLVVVAAGAIHRIWLQEEIARPIREYALKRVAKSPFVTKMISCPPCFAFWSCMLAATLWYIEPISILPLAIYGTLRLALGTMALVNSLVSFVTNPPSIMPAPTHSHSHPPAPTFTTNAPIATTPAQPPTGASCIPCGKGSKRKVVIFTVFNAFARSYSLVGVALDQARALAEQGYLVEFWSSNGSDLREYPTDMPQNVVHLQIVPIIHWKDDIIDRASVDTLKIFIQTQSARLPEGTTIITHDLQFITSYVSFGKALRELALSTKVKWLHMAHSRAAATRPTSEAGVLRSTLVEGHALLYPSPADIGAMAAYYDIAPERVFIAPNIRDITAQNRWTSLAKKIANDAQLMQADIVQVYPYSTPRAKAKGVDTILRVFGKLKEMGNAVRLVLVSAHNHGDIPKTETERIKKIMEREGLSTTEVVFTSERYPESFDGVSGQVVADLQQVANVFVFPSTSESCGLVMLEAGINGQLLVLNDAIPTMFDAVDRSGAIYLPFGQNVDATPAEVIDTAAERIDMHLRASLENISRRGLLRQYSLRAGGEALVAAVEGVWKVDKKVS